MSCNADFSTFAAQTWYIPLFAFIASHKFNKGNSGLGPLSFGSGCPFIVMKNRTGKNEIDKEREKERGGGRERKREKLRVCQGRTQGLWYELPWEWSLPLLGCGSFYCPVGPHQSLTHRQPELSAIVTFITIPPFTVIHYIRSVHWMHKYLEF